MRDKIILITGSYPPMRCGVGDYSSQLSKAIRDKGTEVGVFTSMDTNLPDQHSDILGFVQNWNIRNMLFLSNKIRLLSNPIVHIQYPTIGYGYRLGPQALLMMLRMLGMRVVTTIHEFEHARTLRRLSILPFLIWSNLLIFTSEEERAAAAEAYPWLRGKIGKASHIIPVGSNIPAHKGRAESRDGQYVVSFFGLFYPARKVELVIASFRKALEKQPGLKCRFIGDVHPGHKEYFLKIKRLAEEALPPDHIEWVIGKTPEEIAVALGESDVCVLPFPDGASFRRTTLIAALSLGVPTITTKGSSTPDLLLDGQNVLFAESENAIADMMDKILTSPALSAKLAQNARILSSAFSWEQIAAEHIKVYESLGSNDEGKGKAVRKHS